MPNLQHWLNAWVKVNSKQGAAAPPSTTGGGHHSNRHHHSSSATTTGRPHHGRASHHSSSANSSVSELLAGEDTTTTAKTIDRGGPVVKEAVNQDSSLTIVTESLRSTSIDSAGGGGGGGGGGARFGEGPAPSSEEGSTGPIDLELAAIRKFNSRKHKRRLHRTNSFSDLIREKAKHRSSSSRHVSVERDTTRTSRRHYTSNSQQPQHHHRYPRPAPPPTLHHPLVLPEDNSPHHRQGGADNSSHSSSPTETATTVPRSNKQRQDYDYIRYHHQDENDDDDSDNDVDYHGEEHSLDSSTSALFGVADFFGTELPNLRSAARNTHRGQHGVGGDQPHYLRSLHHVLPPELSSRSSSTSTNNNNYNNHTINGYSPTSTATRLNHHHTQYNTPYAYQQPRYPAGAATTRHYDQATTISSALLPPQTTNSSSRHSTSSSRGTEATATTRRAPQGTAEKVGLIVGGVRLPFFSNHDANKNSSNNKSSQQNSSNNPFGGKANCPGCKVAQAELQHTQESLEYMRDMAIKKEYDCPKCTSAGSSTTGTATRKHHKVLKNSSQQLSEVTARHKKQAEQLMKERNNWQRTMHLKLEKFAILCQNLNTESALRNEESRTLRAELKQVKEERDQMSGELEQLKAAVQVYEQERKEHRLVQEKMVAYENYGLQQAEEAIAKRDETIVKLSARLETTLDTLAKEREQQRQRRQIFFPPRNASNYQTNNGQVGSGDIRSNNNVTGINGDEQDELKRLRAELESAQLEAKRRESELLSRCETLEQQLNDRGSITPGRKTAPIIDHHPFSRENGWESS